MYDDVFHIETFSTHDKDKKVINELLKDGWRILSIIQNSEHDNYSYGQLILGASESAFQKNNLAIMKQKKLEQEAERKRRKQTRWEGVSPVNNNSENTLISIEDDSLPF